MSENLRHRRTPPKAFYIALPIVAVVATTLAVELSLAVFFPVPFSIERNMYFSPDPHTGFRLKPNGKGWFRAGIPANANRHGHRDDEVDKHKAAGTFRLLVLGDSFSVGANVAQDEAYPQVLEALLGGSLEDPIEVVNTAVGGWDPYQYAQYFEFDGRHFEPDLVVIGFFVGNDTYSGQHTPEALPSAVRGRRLTREEAEELLTSPRVFLHEHSHLARLVMLGGVDRPHVRRKACDDFSEHYLIIQKRRMSNHLERSPAREEKARRNIAHLLRIRRLAESQGASTLVVLLPDENQLNPALQNRLLTDDDRSRFDFDMPQSMLREMLAYAGVPFLDLLPTFRQDPRCVFMNDTHWTPTGHAIVARAVADTLMERFEMTSGAFSNGKQRH